MIKRQVMFTFPKKQTLEGKEKDIEKGISWVTSMGVRIDSVTGDVVGG